MAKKIFTGKVVSNKMQKTVVIEIERTVKHPVYKKMIKRTGRIKADINNLSPNMGEFVKIEQTRPISSDKNFKVIEILKTPLAHKPSGGKGGK